MALTGIPRPGAKSTRKARPAIGRRWRIAAAVVLVAGLATGAFFAGKYWPYRYRQIKPLLEDVFGSQITIQAYHRTYFPHPGFMAAGISIRRKSAPDQPAIGWVKSLYVQGRWTDLLMLRRRVMVVAMTGVDLELPPPGSRAAKEDFPPNSSMDFTGSDTPIERLAIHDSVLNVLRSDGGKLSFPIRELLVDNLQKGRTMSYKVDMDNAIPHGRIQATGKFGPLNGRDLGATRASGQFTFTGVQLHDVGNIRGRLSAAGHFDGRLDALATEATETTPDFAVDDGQATRVEGRVRCRINALNGDVAFDAMEARTGSTTVGATGNVAGSPKTTNLDITVRNGRAEDVLRPFLKINPPIQGVVSLHAHARLAPSNAGAGFFQRLQVEGGFDIPAEKVTDRRTEKSLTDFSQRAQGRKTPEDVPEAGEADAVSALAGPATIRNAIVSTHGLTFEVAGARAQLDGTFNLHTSAAHLTGKLTMKADISHVETGFKSFLLKPLAPFFKKKHAGAVIPIAVTGTPGHYAVSQDITHTK